MLNSISHLKGFLVLSSPTLRQKTLRDFDSAYVIITSSAFSIVSYPKFGKACATSPSHPAALLTVQIRFLINQLIFAQISIKRNVFIHLNKMDNLSIKKEFTFLFYGCSVMFKFPHVASSFPPIF